MKCIMVLEKYGNANVPSVNPNKEYSLNKIKIYRYAEVEA